MQTVRLLLVYLTLVAGVYAFLLTGPIGAGLYTAMLLALVLVVPVQQALTARRTYATELASFEREYRRARQLAWYELRKESVFR